MASNPTPVNSSSDNSISADRATQIVGVVTGLAAEIEQIIAASGVGGALNIAQIEQLTRLFGNLAGVAIQAAHDVAGRPITPESVLALMPTATPLANVPGTPTPVA